jgi:ABC-type transport system substrate-binding protein
MTDSNWGVGYYRDPEYRELVSQARRVNDLDERSAIYFEASKKMLADAAMVPLWTGIGVTALLPEVKDFKVGPAGLHVFTDAYIEG